MNSNIVVEQPSIGKQVAAGVIVKLIGYIMLATLLFLLALLIWSKVKVFFYAMVESVTRGVGKPIHTCRPGEEKSGALCYNPPCSPIDGYPTERVGPTCSQKCPNGYDDLGLACKKPEIQTLGLGRIPDKKACSEFNSSYRDDGTSCWLDTYGRGTGYPWKFGDPVFNYDKALARCNAANPGGCELSGAIAYPKCKTGYRSVGCCLCEPVGGPGIKKTAFDRYKCNSDENLTGALCYPKCKHGYNKFGTNFCVPNCPAGMGLDLGLACTKKFELKGGIGNPLTCAQDEENDAALCYKTCDKIDGVKKWIIEKHPEIASKYFYKPDNTDISKLNYQELIKYGLDKSERYIRTYLNLPSELMINEYLEIPYDQLLNNKSKLTQDEVKKITFNGIGPVCWPPKGK